MITIFVAPEDIEVEKLLVELQTILGIELGEFLGKLLTLGHNWTVGDLEALKQILLRGDPFPASQEDFVFRNSSSGNLIAGLEFKKAWESKTITSECELYVKVVEEFEYFEAMAEKCPAFEEPRTSPFYPYVKPKPPKFLDCRKFQRRGRRKK